MKLSDSNFRKFLIFSRKKSFLMFREMETLEKFLKFQGTELPHIS